MPGFLSSNLYYKYLSDLINSVRADEFVNVSTPGQGGPADIDRSGSNASEGPQMQVMIPIPPQPTSLAPVGVFLRQLTFRPAPPLYMNAKCQRDVIIPIIVFTCKINMSLPVTRIFISVLFTSAWGQESSHQDPEKL